MAHVRGCVLLCVCGGVRVLCICVRVRERVCLCVYVCVWGACVWGPVCGCVSGASVCM